MEYISSIHVKFSFDMFIYILQGGIENTLMKLSDKLGNVAIRTEKQHKEEKKDLKQKIKCVWKFEDQNKWEFNNTSKLSEERFSRRNQKAPNAKRVLDIDIVKMTDFSAENAVISVHV